MVLGAVVTDLPGLGITDAALSVACGDRQVALHVSRRAGNAPGPLRWDAPLTLAADDRGLDGPVGLDLRLTLRPAGAGQPTTGSWDGPGLGLVTSTGVATPVDLTVIGTGLGLQGPLELVGTVCEESGLIWSAALAELRAPAPPPCCLATRALVRTDAGLGTWFPDPGDLTLERGTRWPASWRPPGEAEPWPVAARLLARGLGPTDGRWSPGTWHDELAVGLRAWDLAAVDPADVSNLHTFSVLAGPSGASGVLELLALGAQPALGLAGFADGAS